MIKKSEAFLKPPGFSRVELNDKIKVLLSNEDLHKKVVKYSDLENYKEIYQLLPEWEDYKIILLEQKPRMGHWVCLTKRNNVFIFFDTYGYNPFSKFKFHF